MWNPRPFRALRALRGATPNLEGLFARRNRVEGSLDALTQAVSALGASVEALAGMADDVAAIKSEQHRHRLALQGIYDDEPGNRRRLWALRESPEYEVPFTDPEPLVTIYVTTYTNADGLASRSIPSLLDQSYEHLEIIVVGDAAPPEVEEAVRSFDDDRLRFVNLPYRGPYPNDPVELWYVAGTAPANEGLRLASGSWVTMNCDDDVFVTNHVELLLREAQRRRLEIVYGKIRRLDPAGPDVLIGTFPPGAPGEFGVQAALVHGGLRMFPFELMEAVFGAPGDYAWIRRMLRIGVRIGMIDDIVVDYYPSQLWGTPTRAPGLLGVEASDGARAESAAPTGGESEEAQLG